MNTKWKVLIAVILSCTAMTSCHTKNCKEEDIIRCVEVVVATAQDGKSLKSYSGRVQESDQIDVAFKTGGQIEKIYVSVGQRVIEGQLLATVESKDYELELRNYEIQYRQLESEVERLTTLYENRTVSKNDYEKAVAGLERLGITVEGNQRRIGYTKLFAPASGVITEVYYSTAELVDAGMAVFSLLVEHELKVQFDLTASDYLQRENLGNFGCRPAFAPDKLLPMKIESITPKADNSQLYRATLVFTGQTDQRLAPGMTVSVELQQTENSESSGVNLPLSCVCQDGDENIVWIVCEDNHLQRQPVFLGTVEESGIVSIIKGLNGGERVVKAAASSLRDGERVRVLPEPSNTNVGNLL